MQNNKLPRGATIITIPSLFDDKKYKVRNSIINKYESIEAFVVHLQETKKRHKYLQTIKSD